MGVSEVVLNGQAIALRGKSMAFSFADLGFWRLAIVSFVLELLHLILESHWPEIRGSRIGPRTPGAEYFMLIEAVALFVALAAAIGSVSRMVRVVPRPTNKVATVALTALCLLGVFFFVWQR